MPAATTSVGGAGSIATIVVETDAPGIDGIVGTVPRYKYPQLERKSRLNEAFNELNVLSIRRVFRMTEVEGKGDVINVHSMNSLLASSKQKYRVRASRGLSHQRRRGCEGVAALQQPRLPKSLPSLWNVLVALAAQWPLCRTRGGSWARV